MSFFRNIIARIIGRAPQAPKPDDAELIAVLAPGAKKGVTVRRRRRRERLIARDGTDCWYCGLHMVEHDRTIEHLQPRARGGTNEDDNLVLAHAGCNQRAGILNVKNKRKLRDKMRAENEGQRA